MATLANIFNQFLGAGTATDAAPRSVTWETSEESKLRALPNEDVYLFTKRIDNSRVVRQVDTKARARDWKVLGGGTAAAILAIAISLPPAYGLIAGYQLSQLQVENERLRAEQLRLKVEEARMSSAERLQEWADTHKFVAPGSDKTIYLEPKNQEAIALNRR
ncbi:MAG TPA: hypothetical protein VER03_11995 [Bryobacteraceae bacterium]|nr:hypothetical protein [Bryobacteraceae bacterium]